MPSIHASLAVLSLAVSALGTVAGAAQLWLDQMPLDGYMHQDFGTPQVNHNIDGGAFSLRLDKLPGVAATRGVGTHANSLYLVDLKGAATRFQAVVGFDGGGGGSVQFLVIGDGKALYTSPIMNKDGYAAAVDVNLAGVKRLVLQVDEAEGGIVGDHADWVNAVFTYADGSGSQPVPESPLANPPQMGILTPPVSAAPVLTFPRKFGLRPGSPLLFTCTAAGDRPMTFSASGLPAGVILDPATGRLSGTVAAAGTYVINVTAKSQKGQAERALKLVVGNDLALTPPRGWNAFNVWGLEADDAKVRQAADALVTTGLFNQGFTYVNIDDGWEGKRIGAKHTLQPDSSKYPDMRGLIDYVHGKGLRFGLYSSPWKFTFGDRPGSTADNADGTSVHATDVSLNRVVGAVSFVSVDAAEWADWGVDFLKYDWIPNDGPVAKPMSDALKAQNRDIVFSLANAAGVWQAYAIMPLSNLVRTSFDVHDRWEDLKGAFRTGEWRQYQGPGHWGDEDMLVVGVLGGGFKEPNHPTNLTHNEQYLHMTLWSLLASPLMLGCDLAKLDPFTLSLLTNQEVLEVNQDPLGLMAERVPVPVDQKSGFQERWYKPLEDGTLAVGLFNLSDAQEQDMTLRWSDLKLTGKQQVRDLWKQQDIGILSDSMTVHVPVHGGLMFKLTPSNLAHVGPSAGPAGKGSLGGTGRRPSVRAGVLTDAKARHYRAEGRQVR